MLAIPRPSPAQHPDDVLEWYTSTIDESLAQHRDVIDALADIDCSIRTKTPQDTKPPPKIGVGQVPEVRKYGVYHPDDAGVVHIISLW